MCVEDKIQLNIYVTHEYRITIIIITLFNIVPEFYFSQIYKQVFNRIHIFRI